MHTTLLLLCLVALVFGQDFQCSLEYRTRLMRNGVVRGDFKMSALPNGRTLITLPATANREAFTELAQYNQANGFNGGSALPYTDQIVFRSGTSCACETGYVDSALPLLHPWSPPLKNLLAALYDKQAAQVNGCDVYKIKGTPDPANGLVTSLQLDKINVPLNEVHLKPDTFLPCYADFKDGRKLTFVNCAAVSPNFTRTNTFVEPSNCKCGKPIDLAIVLDRSGSISLTEFNDQKGFVIDFVSQFEFDQYKANLAIINFQSKAWVHLALKEGISKSNVDQSVNALGCPSSCDQTKSSCTGKPADCCCCCGTCISCGMRAGADELPTGRSFAFKLLITITDGFANHLYTSAPCGTTAACNQDLRDAVTYTYSKVPKDRVALYAVGVGGDRDVSAEQLLIIADGVQSRVLRRDNFAQLASVNVELISRSCDQNAFPCGGCCGFCLCGKCQQPDTCDDVSPCNKGLIPTGQTCCSSTPTSCAAQAAEDKCSNFICDDRAGTATTGTCIVSNVTDCGKPANETCFTRNCTRSTGLCVTSINRVACPTVTECVPENVTTCNDDNMCTIDKCTANTCGWDPVDCTTQFPPNRCSSVECSPSSGCFRKPFADNYCDDGNNCTIDICDDVEGCKHTPVVCDDQKPCTVDTCDPIRGCLFAPKICTLSNASCRVSFCNETDGNCTFRAVPCGTEIPNNVIIGATVGAAALVGIIIAAILCAAGLAGGGAYAYVQANNGEGLSNVSSNPLYQASGVSGVNPFFKAGGN